MLAFLFDNDGVLIDSSALHWESWLRLMEEEPRIAMTHEAFKRGFGKRNDLILQEIAPDISPELHGHLAERKEELFRECARGHIELLPGMEPFLLELKRLKVPRIIASSTPPENLELFLNSTVLGEYFDAYVSAESVAHGKPAPDVFLAAADQLGLPASSCIVIEDAPAGIESGKAAGAFVIALATTHLAEQLLGYDLLFETPADLDLEVITTAFENWRER